MRWWVVIALGLASCKGRSQPALTTSGSASASVLGSASVAPPASPSAPSALAPGSYEAALSIPASASPLTEEECKRALPDRMADDCDVDGKALLKIAVADGEARGATILLTTDRPTALECLRKRIVASTFRRTPGLSRCLRTFRQPDQEITEFPEPPWDEDGIMTPWKAEPWNPSSPPKGLPLEPGLGFDRAAAKQALAAVPYRDCGTGGDGKVTITFATSGSATSVVVTAGDYDGATRSCIQNRFRGVKVPAFGGAPMAVGWSIRL